MQSQPINPIAPDIPKAMVYGFDLNNLTPWMISQAYELLDKEQACAIDSMLSEQVRMQSMCAHIMKKTLLKKSTVSKKTSLFSHDTHPFHSISHSGNMVVLAFSEETRIGADVEAIREVNLSDFQDCFQTDEWVWIMKSVKPFDAFYKLWVKKESVIKADGRGMEIPLNSFNVIGSTTHIDNTQWYIYELDIPGRHPAAIASERQISIHFNLFNMNSIFSTV